MNRWLRDRGAIETSILRISVLKGQRIEGGHRVSPADATFGPSNAAEAAAAPESNAFRRLIICSLLCENADADPTRAARTVVRAEQHFIVWILVHIQRSSVRGSKVQKTNGGSGMILAKCQRASSSLLLIGRPNFLLRHYDVGYRWADLFLKQRSSKSLLILTL